MSQPEPDDPPEEFFRCYSVYYLLKRERGSTFFIKYRTKPAVDAVSWGKLDEWYCQALVRYMKPVEKDILWSLFWQGQKPYKIVPVDDMGKYWKEYDEMGIRRSDDDFKRAFQTVEYSKW